MPKSKKLNKIVKQMDITPKQFLWDNFTSFIISGYFTALTDAEKQCYFIGFRDMLEVFE